MCLKLNTLHGKLFLKLSVKTNMAYVMLSGAWHSIAWAVFISLSLAQLYSTLVNGVAIKFESEIISNILLLAHVRFTSYCKHWFPIKVLFYSQVPDRNFSFHVGQSGYWLGHLSVCGGSCLVSTQQGIQFKVYSTAFCQVSLMCKAEVAVLESLKCSTLSSNNFLFLETLRKEHYV